jgi:MAF protein
MPNVMENKTQPEKKAPRLVLASASPRRQQLLALTGWRAQVRPPQVDERQDLPARPADLARELAARKARAAADPWESGATILGADTIVVHDGNVLGKPKDRAEATAMLRRLEGKEHLVLTAIALLDPNRDLLLQDLCQTTVPMAPLSAGQIEAYVASGSPMDKAGAYGIQDQNFRVVEVERMRGCFANVMGLPLCHLVRLMSWLGFEPPRDVPAACQKFTAYPCMVYQEILG